MPVLRDYIRHTATLATVPEYPVIGTPMVHGGEEERIRKIVSKDDGVAILYLHMLTKLSIDKYITHVSM